MVSEIISSKESSRIDWLIKGKKCRMDISSKAGEFQNNYRVDVEGPEAKMIVSGRDPITIPSKEKIIGPVITETGMIEKIAGTECKKIIVNHSNGKIEIWMGEIPGLSISDLPEYFSEFYYFLSPNEKQKLFPFKIIFYDKENKISSSQEITSVVKRDSGLR